MTDAIPMKLRIIAFKEGEAWCAQCIEYDIAAQAPDLDTLVSRMNTAIVIEADHTRSVHGTPFGGLDPAPSYFEAMFESVHTSICAPCGGAVPGADFRIAA